jgi:tryptophanyl-tRNA synthetase
MRIFSGIQPTGAKQFGNYSGGFRQYAATQEEGEAFFCIVDLRSTSPRSSSRRESTPTARPSSSKATSPRTPRPLGC